MTTDLYQTVQDTLTKILNDNPSTEMLLEVYKEEMKFKSLILQCETRIEETKIKTTADYQISLAENGYVSVEE